MFNRTIAGFLHGSDISHGKDTDSNTDTGTSTVGAATMADTGVNTRESSFSLPAPRHAIKAVMRAVLALMLAFPLSLGTLSLPSSLQSPAYALTPADGARTAQAPSEQQSSEIASESRRPDSSAKTEATSTDGSTETTTTVSDEYLGVTDGAAKPENHKAHTVRAGIFAFDGYHMRDDDGEYYGYGIEVLELISKYSHLNFDLVAFDSSWSDMLTMLENGEIDVVTSASKTPEREEKFDYSLPIGRKATVVSVLVDDERFISGNYSTYNDMTVGEIEGNSQNDIFAEFANDKGFSYTVEVFPDETALEDALHSGQVDAIVSSDLRKRNNEKTLDTIEENSYYAIVRKGETGLLNEINYAIEQMNVAEGDWQNELYYKYYGPSYSRALDFTEREESYIEQVRSGEKSIQVTALPDRRPYSYLSEDGDLTGIMIDYFSDVMEIAGLPYEMVIPSSMSEYEELIQNGNIDIVLDGVANRHSPYSFANGFATESYITAGVVQVTRSGFDDDEIQTIAIAESSTSSLSRFLEKQEGKTILEYPDREEALQAVLDGKADCAYVYDYTAQEFMNRNITNSLSYSAVHGLTVEFSMIVNSETDHELVTILNKCVKQIPEGTLMNLVTRYVSYDAHNTTFLQFLALNPLIAGALAVIVLLIAALVFLAIRWAALSQRMAETEKKANAAKTTFLNSVSHDIRTPMNSIIGYTSLAAAHIDDPEQVQEYLEKIMTSSDHLLSLINDVLDMSRIESGKVKLSESDTDIGSLVESLVTIVKSDADAKRISVSTDLSGVSDPYVKCDRLRVNQILLNILSNAIKYTENGGSVKIEVSECKAPERETGFRPADVVPDIANVGGAEDELGQQQAGKNLYIFSVTDTGIGMSREFLEHVFDPFEREDSKENVKGIQGTGLGLSITKSLVELMSGEVSVESELGKGSVFRVSIPLEIGDASACADEEESNADKLQVSLERASEALGGMHILLADDNLMSREIAKTILQDVGICVDDVEDGIYAVERMQNNPPGTYDAVLTDIQMPIMDGYETTREIRLLDDPDKANIPIIAVTANVFEEEREKASAAGVSGYIPKPIEIPVLMSVLEDLAGDTGNTSENNGQDDTPSDANISGAAGHIRNGSDSDRGNRNEDDSGGTRVETGDDNIEDNGTADETR